MTRFEIVAESGLRFCGPVRVGLDLSYIHILHDLIIGQATNTQDSEARGHEVGQLRSRPALVTVL